MADRPRFDGDEAGRCGGCGSRNLTTVKLPDRGITYGHCRECGRGQDVELRDWPEATPCDDCAFRKGSPERSDPDKWAGLEELVKGGGTFHCHKGLPHDIATGSYAAPDAATGRVTVCAGWIGAHVAYLRRLELERAAAEGVKA